VTVVISSSSSGRIIITVFKCYPVRATIKNMMARP